MKLIRQSLKNPHLYSEDEILYMREQLKQLEEIRQTKIKENYRGFGT